MAVCVIKYGYEAEKQIWCALWDLNLRHAGCKPAALTN